MDTHTHNRIVGIIQHHPMHFASFKMGINTMTVKTEKTSLITLPQIARKHNVKPAYVRRLARKHDHFKSYDQHNWFWDTKNKTDQKSIAVVNELAKSLTVKKQPKKPVAKK